MRELLLFGVMFVAVLAVLGTIVGWGKFVEWRASVKSSQEEGVSIMSRDEEVPIENAARSLQTRPDQAQDQTEDPRARRQRLLYIYGILRKHNVSRNDARLLLNALGAPLDNNLWAQAVPSEPPTVTPIAGRPTSAKFHEDDPELKYQPLHE